MAAAAMTTRFKKNRKHPGGRGNVGGMHHHRILSDKYHLGYFDKVGMCYFHRLRNKFYCLTVNIDRLQSLIPDDVKMSAVARGDNSTPSIGVTQFGYFKILGRDAPAYQLLY
ncbi:large ribosomal subunit protein uL15x-like [Elaeis guineensis]|uniref:60S ribosomal protein L27a-3-like n=1 Tax=Elaeis guineensis var. tenera TaxID=51953 RepID=A0A6J0PDK0_ELAGV|nr:60S ribosomal protein L27a-3-like [Elaeis guineensis]